MYFYLKFVYEWALIKKKKAQEIQEYKNFCTKNNVEKIKGEGKNMSNDNIKDKQKH